MRSAPEEIARAFHETYHRRAPEFGYQPRYDVAWEKLPSENRDLMIAVARELVRTGHIVPGMKVGGQEWHE